MIEMFFNKFPQFKKHLLGINIYQLAQVADWTPGISIDFTPEQKAELARLRKSIAESKSNIAEYDKLNGIGELIKEKTHKKR